MFLFQIYQNNQAAIDEVLGKVKVQLDEIKSKVVAVMPAQVTKTMTSGDIKITFCSISDETSCGKEGRVKRDLHEVTRHLTTSILKNHIMNCKKIEKIIREKMAKNINMRLRRVIQSNIIL